MEDIADIAVKEDNEIAEERFTGNVLVLGDSGVGKSTLINAVLGEKKTIVGYGTKGTTDHLAIFTSNEINFRMIDSVGFEPDLFKRMRAIKAVKDWSKKAAKAGDGNTDINVVWFCVDGTARKLFPQQIDSLARAVSVFRSAPIIVVITKSYSKPDREANVEMVRRAFSGKLGRKLNFKGVIPVVAEMYQLDETAFAPVDGITDLIQLTNEVMPEGLASAKKDIDQYKLDRTNVFAHSLIGASAASGVVVGAIPIPGAITDATILSGIELAMVSRLAKLYGIRKSNKSMALLQKIVELGTVSAVARAACGAVLKVIPVAGWIANAAVAGSFIMAIGETSRYIFEQISLGNKTIEDIDWAEKMIRESLSGKLPEKAKAAFSALSENSTKDDIIKAVTKMLQK